MIESYSIIGFLVGLMFISVTLFKLKKQTINQSTFVIWILIGVGVITISIVPTILSTITSVIGTDFAVSAVLGASTLLLLGLVFYLHQKIDVVNQRITKLVSEIAANKFYCNPEKNDESASK